LREPVLQLEVAHLLQQVGVAGLTPEALHHLVGIRMRAPVREHAPLERALVRDRAAPERQPPLGRLLERLRVRDTAAGAEGDSERGPGERTPQWKRQELQRRPVARAEARVTEIRAVAVEELIRALADLDDDRPVLTRE